MTKTKGSSNAQREWSNGRPVARAGDMAQITAHALGIVEAEMVDGVIPGTN